jgi:hypothetical protein
VKKKPPATKNRKRLLNNDDCIKIIIQENGENEEEIMREGRSKDIMLSAWGGSVVSSLPCSNYSTVCTSRRRQSSVV